MITKKQTIYTVKNTKTGKETIFSGYGGKSRRDMCRIMKFNVGVIEHKFGIGIDECEYTPDVMGRNGKVKFIIKRSYK